MKKTFLLLTAWAFFAQCAVANTVEVWRGIPLNAVTASADHTSSSWETDDATHGSLQCVWAGLGGTIDGQIIVYISNSRSAATPVWTAKSGATITVAGASGNESISLNGIVTEENYQVRWVHNNVNAGIVTCYGAFKG